MRKIEKNVFSVYRAGYIGNTPIKKCKGPSCNECGKYDDPENDSVQPLLPAGIQILCKEDNQENNETDFSALRQYADENNLLLPSTMPNEHHIERIYKTDDNSNEVAPMIPVRKNLNSGV